MTASCTPPANGCTTFAHDAYGNVTVTTDPLAHTQHASYDADGNKTAATDGNGRTTGYTFDAADQPVTTTRPDTSMIVTTYNGDGTVATVKDAAGDDARQFVENLAAAVEAPDVAYDEGARDRRGAAVGTQVGRG